MVAVTATPEIRYERMKKRGRIGDEVTFEIFKKEESVEKRGGSGTHELSKVIENADYKIDNSGSGEEFKKKVDEWFRGIIKR